jgi:bacillolysin
MSRFRHLISLGLVAGLLARGPALTRVNGAAGRLTVAATSTADLRQWDAAVTQMSRDGELRLRRVTDDTMLAGRSHERLDQYYKGIRIFGGDVVRQMDGTLPVSVFGQLYSGIDLDSTPALSADDATAVVERAGDPELTIGRAPELVVLPLEAGGYRLAYRLRVATKTDRIVYFVDARTGGIVLEYSDLQHQEAIGSGRGVFGDLKKVSAKKLATGTFVAEDLFRPPHIDTYDLHGNLDRTLNFLNGLISLGTSDLASSSDNMWTDAPDVDGHVYAGYTYDYYFKRYGRRGLDDHNVPVTVVIHPVRRQDVFTASQDTFDLLYVNAFYAGDGIVVYGEGLPTGYRISPFQQSVDFFSSGLDIVAHELSHGVTDYSSGLIYQNESGALNEAFSDFMGVSVKFFFRPSGNGLMQASYELGSDVFRPGGIRSFDNPGLFRDPDHYTKRVVGTDDNGGVHTNCTIADHAFYLAIEGGTNRTSGLSVQGVGAANREQIEKVFYRGFTLMLTSNATFSMARAATIQAARDLYGPGSAPERAVTQAWTAVGVL